MALFLQGVGGFERTGEADNLMIVAGRNSSSLGLSTWRGRFSEKKNGGGTLSTKSMPKHSFRCDLHDIASGALTAFLVSDAKPKNAGDHCYFIQRFRHLGFIIRGSNRFRRIANLHAIFFGTAPLDLEVPWWLIETVHLDSQIVWKTLDRLRHFAILLQVIFTAFAGFISILAHFKQREPIIFRHSSI